MEYRIHFQKNLTWLVKEWIEGDVYGVSMDPVFVSTQNPNTCVWFTVGHAAINESV